MNGTILTGEEALDWLGDVLGRIDPASQTGAAWKQERSALASQLPQEQAVSRASSQLVQAIALAATGHRVAPTLLASDLPTLQPLLRQAVASHLPIVIHLYAGAHPEADNSFAGSLNLIDLAAQSGIVLLAAKNADEAVTLSLVAQHLAEEALVPVMVAMEHHRVARALHDLQLPSAVSVQSLIEKASDIVGHTTEAQRWIFGETRRRVPRWHDLDRPALHGARLKPCIGAAATAAQQPFFAAEVPALLEGAFSALDAQLGRCLSPVSISGESARPELVLVAHGSAAEVAESVAHRLSLEKHLRVATLAIRCLSPFPTTALLDHLRGRNAIMVLEEGPPPFFGDPPVTTRLHASLGRAMEPGHLGTGRPWRSRDIPRIGTVYCSVGGAPLRAADLFMACERFMDASRTRAAFTPSYLGVSFAAKTATYPKQQAAQTQLARAYPGIEALGTRAPLSLAAAAATAKHGFAIRLSRLASDGGGEPLSRALATTLHKLLGGRIRAEFERATPEQGGRVYDQVVWLPDEVPGHPGDEVPANLIIVESGGGIRAALDGPLSEGSVILLEATEGAAPIEGDCSGALEGGLTASQLTILRQHGTTLHTVKVPKAPPGAPAEIALEYLLGAALAILAHHRHLEVSSLLKVQRARESVLRSSMDGEPSAGEQAETLPRRLESIKRGFESVQSVALETLSTAPPALAAETEPPLVIRRAGGDAVGFDSLTRFWDQAGVFYQYGPFSELRPDPVMATGALPAFSAALRDLSGDRCEIPVIDTARCTGCGQCWTLCPDGAIAPLVIAPRALLNAGISLAKDDGAWVQPLQPFLGKLTKAVERRIAQSETAPAAAAELIRPAFEALVRALGADEERQQALQEAFGEVCSHLEPLPLIPR